MVMRYPNFRPHAASPRNAGTLRQKSAPAAGLDSHTVGAYLRSLYPEQFSEDWVARQLACEAAAVRELLECWVPTVTPQILERSVGVFAAHLGIDRKRLLSLMVTTASAPVAAPKAEFSRPRSSAPRHDSERAPPGVPAAPREPGVRSVSVTWQKPKRSFSLPGAAEGQPAAPRKFPAAPAEPNGNVAPAPRRPDRKTP